MSRSPELRASLAAFKRRLLAAVREDLFGHFERTISGYEDELDRNRKLLDAVSHFDSKRRGAVSPADVLQPVVTKEEAPEQQGPSSSLDQRLSEPPHIKEEQGEGGVGAHAEDCGGSEPDRTLDPDWRSQPEIGGKDSDSPEHESEDGDPNRRFRCSKCGKTCTQRGNLNTHMRTHTGEKPFSCSLCGKRFTQKVGLHYHLKIHTGEKPFCCSVCGKNFRQKGALKYHVLTHTGMKPFSCSVCNRRFRWSSQIRVHKCVGESSQRHRNKHKKPLSCSECGETFPNNSLLMTHKRIHKGKKLLTCTVCGLQRQFSSQMEIHMRSHTGERPYSCSICGKRFTQRGIMMQHMAVHSGVKPFSCSDCGRRFFWHFQIKKHKCPGKLPQNQSGLTGEECAGPEAARPPSLGTHAKAKPPADTDDSVDIDFWKDIRQHQSGFTYQRKKKVSLDEEFNTVNKLFSCSNDKAKFEPKSDESVDSDFCRQNRQRQSGLDDSESEDIGVSAAGSDPKKKPLGSSECRKRSEVGHMLQTHKKCHSAEKAFSCFLCGKGFGSKHHLQIHVRLHTGEKPFSCSVCEERFAKCESLSFHMTCHTGETSLRCSVCDTGFSDRESLIQHMRIHTRQTQFSCSICGKEFAWRRYLTKHMEVHAKEKSSSCSVCDRGSTCCYELSHRHCSQLHQGQTEEDREAEPPASSSAEHMETEADGEDCGGPEPARSPDPDPRLRPVSEDRTSDSSEPETDDGEFWKRIRQSPSASNCVKDQVFESGMGCSADEASGSFNPQSDDSVDSDFWKESRNPPPCSDSLRHSEESQSERTCDAGRKHLSRSESGETFSNSHPLKIHVSIHTGEEPSSCSTCGEQFPRRAGLSQHMATHTGGQGDPEQEQPEPPHIKEEQEELWSSQEGEQLGGLEEADITRFIFTPVPVKTEEEEEKPQSSQLHQGQTEEDREAEPPASSSAEHMETEADGEDCGGPEPAGNPDPDPRPQPGADDKVLDSSEPETDDSDFWKESRQRQSGLDVESLEPESDDSVDSDFWKESRKPRLGLNSLKNTEVCESDMRYNSLRKPYSCSECGKRFLYICHMKTHMRRHTVERPFFCSVCGQKCLYKSHLKIHMRTHTGEKPFVCPVCGKKYAHKASMQSHMIVHTVEKRYNCSVCDKSFAWYTELKYHRCVGESSREHQYWRDGV